MASFLVLTLGALFVFLAEATQKWTPKFVAPTLTPLQFLFASSPKEGKIVYTQLKNFKAIDGVAKPLVDSGLGEPCGIAFDRDRGDLYVADRLAQKIFRYGVMVKEDRDWKGHTSYELVTDGIRLTLVTGTPVEWVTVDHYGNLFFTDPSTKSINKVPAKTLNQLASGEFEAEQLVYISEKEQEAKAATQATSDLNKKGSQSLAPDEPEPKPEVLRLFEAGSSPHASEPAGLATDGIRLFWTNAKNGTHAGSAVRGAVNPNSPLTRSSGSQAATFESTVLATNIDSSFGIAKSHNMILYTGPTDVYGMMANGGPTYTFLRGLGQPRGLVWDGDNTVFVADQNSSTVWSFPVGRLIENAPKTPAMELSGAFGIALLQEGDDAFDIKASASRVAGLSLMSMLAALAMLNAAP
eukprot:gnl/TRDRNA2_/TRDRNA2_181605_c0_seq1.p1 gnl/TRDRNA2_/TRDRNA2_181605_c0~~gnl/TRDRNA2_/TRDRNA2_181605_c0_seq1.p1  ORF type:complete len:410 (-),score=90.45 gnl/TRDRNA2_/TRDRNA2_181605_c0_seq1:40-1269(-)